MMTRRVWTTGLVMVVLAMLSPAAMAQAVVRVFVEHPIGDRDDLTLAVLTEPYFFRGAAWPEAGQDAPKSMERQADEAVAYWKTMPPGYRAACWGGWFFTPLVEPRWHGFADLPLADPMKDFRNKAISNVAWETARLRVVAERAEKAGITIDFNYFDFESGYNAWGWPGEAETARIVADTEARRRFSAALRLATSDKTAPAWGQPKAYEWKVEFTRYTGAMNAAAMRTALAESGLRAVSTTIVNYEFTNVGGFTAYDANGWPVGLLDQTLDKARTSCPSVYLGSGRHRLSSPALAKDPLWNALIENVNRIRSLLAVGGGAVVPVVSACEWSPARAVASEALIAHGVRSGVSTWNLWNPPDCRGAGQERAIAGMFARHARWAPAKRRVLPEIPLDAEAIDTDGFVTTYAAFLAAARPEIRTATTPAE